MKNILYALLCIMPISSFATQMCVENDTVAVVMNASQSTCNVVSYNPMNTGGDGSWSVQLPYGTIYGTSACVSANYGDTVAEITDNGAVVVGGEANGVNCYCRLTHPAVSVWVRIGYNLGSDCSSICVRYCAGRNGHGMCFNLLFRQNILGSISD